MKKKTIFTMNSIYRDDFRITGYEFGSGEKSACIVGSTRGNEVQQVYICSQLVKHLKKLEAAGCIKKGKSILIIPTANHFSMNIGKRFWVSDNTDINRMFPGYNLGETTQRIAAGLFEKIQHYEYGIQFTSNYLSGVYIPHVRMMETGYETPELAMKFGLPYTVLRKPRPYDTTTLNYNWQIWETRAFSIYACETDYVENMTAEMCIEAVLRFLKETDLIDCETSDVPFPPKQISESQLVSVKASKAGILKRKVRIYDYVREGEVIAEVIDPYEGEVLEKIKSGVSGNVFFYNDNPLITANTIVFRIVPE